MKRIIKTEIFTLLSMKTFRLLCGREHQRSETRSQGPPSAELVKTAVLMTGSTRIEAWFYDGIDLWFITSN